MPTLIQYVLAGLLVAHGWVHVVYVGSSQGWFGSDEGWGWNGRSWLLSDDVDAQFLLDVVTVFFVLVALGFGVGAVAYVRSWDWWAPLLAGSAVLSAILYVVLWDGDTGQPFEKGGLGVLIDVSIVVWVIGLN